MKNLIEVIKQELPGEPARHEAHKGQSPEQWDAAVRALAGRLHAVVIDELHKAVKDGAVCLHQGAAALVEVGSVIDHETKAAMPLFALIKAVGYKAAIESLPGSGE